MLTHKPHLLSKPIDPGIGSAKIIRNLRDLVFELLINVAVDYLFTNDKFTNDQLPNDQ